MSNQNNSATDYLAQAYQRKVARRARPKLSSELMPCIDLIFRFAENNHYSYRDLGDAIFAKYGRKVSPARVRRFVEIHAPEAFEFRKRSNRQKGKK